MEKSTFYIVGRHAVTEALRNPKRRVIRVFLTEESKKNIHRNNPNQNLLKNTKIYFKTKKELDKYCAKDQITHQGMVAEVEHLEKLSLKEFVIKNDNTKNINLVVLEGITDPRNIGSIIRSAASFNIDGVIVKQRAYPSESKLLFKSASGCMEIINIFEVSNISSSLKYLKSKNFWISGFDISANKDFINNDWNGKNVLIFGSEGDGLKHQIKKNADFLFSININKKVESLNVSNSASVVFHYINNKIKK
tara:strand:- start:1612 stop:2361 length:750 start_codon:yes stop_codon:yes gene_type:complete